MPWRSVSVSRRCEGTQKVSNIQGGLQDQDPVDKILQVFHIVYLFSPKNQLITTCFKFRQTEAEGGKFLHKAGKSPYTTRCENPVALYTGVISHWFCALQSYWSDIKIKCLFQPDSLRCASVLNSINCNINIFLFVTRQNGCMFITNLSGGLTVPETKSGVIQPAIMR